MGNRFRDFDEFHGIRKSQEPITFRVKGEIYTLPLDLSVKAALLAVRLSEEDLPESEKIKAISGLLGSLFGDKQRDRILDSGISIPDLQDILEWVLEQYQDEARGVSTNSENA